MTKDFLLRQTHVCQDKTFVATKMILVAAPANDKKHVPVFIVLLNKRLLLPSTCRGLLWCWSVLLEEHSQKQRPRNIHEMRSSR